MGKGAEGACGGLLGMEALCPEGEAAGLDGEGGLPGKAGGDAPGKGSGVYGRDGLPMNSQMLAGLDNSLSFIYDSAQKGASLDASAPYVPKNLAEWLQNIRRFFPKETVALVQKDAIERKGLKNLLFEPETMPLLEKNVELVATLLQYKHFIPDKAREMARQLVGEIVEEIRKKLENEVRQAVIGALTRNRHSVIPVYRNIDWDRTIRRNLKHYNQELKSIIPERFYFWANQLKLYEWRIIVLVDQSGSMGTSIVYSSIMGAIFASINVLKTHLIFFDTEIVDMTPNLNDPVDILFGARLGGGTDIARAVSYAAELVENPEKTILLLITDLYEGGSQERLLRRLEGLVESHVKTLCLLALTDDGNASYDRVMAKKVAATGVHAFGCTPKKLVTIIERIMKGQRIKESVTA